MKTLTASVEQILLAHGYMPLTKNKPGQTPSKALLGTFLSNLAYYGFVPSTQVMSHLSTISDTSLKALWKKLEPALKDNSGEGRDIGKYVVYKNFPQEVLDMSLAEYWIKQILMYIGLPNELFTQEEEPRAAMFEELTFKVLHAADDMSALRIFEHLLKLPNRWTDTQTLHVNSLLGLYGKAMPITIDMATVGFKENGLNALLTILAQGGTADFSIHDATDVLRLAAGLSGHDVSLRDDNITFRKFKRSERRLLLEALENSKNIGDDFAARPGDWKRLMMILHPGDYALPRVNSAYDKLYKGEVRSFASKVEPGNITYKDLALLKSRPGEFVRRFHAVYYALSENRGDVVDAFLEVIPKLTSQQIVKFRRYLETISYRRNLMYPPKGNWGRVQIVPNHKAAIIRSHMTALVDSMDSELATRINQLFPEGVLLDDSADWVKLQTNDQKLASYGRGTEFPIPENINFIRAASYWGDKKAARSHNTWMDNGFNFYDYNWKPHGTICWNSIHAHATTTCAFSGDPTNSKTADGKATQVIDLYIDALVNAGVRYAVWNILSYNNIPFDDVNDIYASLQWGEDAFAGKVYEPSRAQMEFQVTGPNKTKYIAYIDLVARKLVYMDANLKGIVSSATQNASAIGEKMPAFVEYLYSLPSVHDLFRSAKAGTVPVTFSDKELDIETEDAYVFRPENPDNTFNQIDLNTILS